MFAALSIRICEGISSVITLFIFAHFYDLRCKVTASFANRAEMGV